MSAMNAATPADESCAGVFPPPLPRDLHFPPNFPASGKSSSSSYIALISMAILASEEKRLVLGDIYKILARWLPDRYNTSKTAWRNSIRHNLSLNECFVKAGRAANGKGNYWAIHPACVESFARGDYRRRHARRRAVASKTRPPLPASAAAASLTSLVADAGSTDISQIATTGQNATEYITMSQVTVFNGCNVGRMSVEQLISLIPASVGNPQPSNV